MKCLRVNPKPIEVLPRRIRMALGDLVVMISGTGGGGFCSDVVDDEAVAEIFPPVAAGANAAGSRELSRDEAGESDETKEDAPKGPP